MKRKHEDGAESQELTDTAPMVAADESMLDSESSFSSFGLDPRLLQGVAKLGFANPTLVQAKAIPLALEGKDILGTVGLVLKFL
jgi:ATP-dependent RNA helicase DDX56/DBP9